MKEGIKVFITTLLISMVIGMAIKVATLDYQYRKLSEEVVTLRNQKILIEEVPIEDYVVQNRNGIIQNANVITQIVDALRQGIK